MRVTVQTRLSASPSLLGVRAAGPLIRLSAAALGLRDEFEALDHVGGDGHRVTRAGRRQKMDLHSFIHPTYPAVWLIGYWSLISAIFGVKAANHPSTVTLDAWMDGCTQSAQCATLGTLGGSLLVAVPKNVYKPHLNAT